MLHYFNYIMDNKFVKTLIIFIVLDTIFGILRAIRQKKINSSIGIDGIIRKVGMLISIFFFMAIDLLHHINLIGFVPEELRKAIGISEVGVAGLFNTLFIIFESLSVLKNMIKCKLPIPKKLQVFLENVLNKFTTELKEGENK